MKSNRDTYYSSFYKNLQRKGIQGWGNSIIDRLIEARVRRFEGMKILELGGSSGEHLQFVSLEPKWDCYVCLDRAPGISDPELFRNLTRQESPTIPGVTFIQGTAERIPFPDQSFDLVISTCLLAHVRDAETVLSEICRVTKDKGQVVIGLPTDPGLFNRFVKRFITYPKMKRLGIVNPRLEYAREHINGISNLLEIIKHQFNDASLRLQYFPFVFKSWNLNLVVIVDYKVQHL